MNKTFRIVCSFLISMTLLFSVVFKLNAEPSKDFIKSKDTKFYDSNDKEYHIKSIGLGNGVWTSKDNGWQSYDHNEDTYKEIHDLGFNAVRYYFRYSWFEEKGSNGEPAIFERFDRDIAWAKKYGIKIYFNMHYAPTNDFGFHGYSLWKLNDNKTNTENRAKVVAMWEALAKRYANEDTVLGWGLMNEPIPYYQENKTVKEMIQPWINTAKMFKDAIRKYDTNHIIFAELSPSVNKDGKYTGDIDGVSVMNECMNQLKYQVFGNDNNYCFEFHCYTPWNFSSYGIDGSFEPLTEDGLKLRDNYMKNLSWKIKRLNVTPFLGEFGVSRNTFASQGYKEELNGSSFVNETLDFCETSNVSFNYHQYRDNIFGLHSTSYKTMDNPDLYNVFKTRLAELYVEKEAEETEEVESKTPDNEVNVSEDNTVKENEIDNKPNTDTDTSTTVSSELPKTSGFNKNIYFEIGILAVIITALVILNKSKSYLKHM